MKPSASIETADVHKLLRRSDRALKHNKKAWRAASIPYYGFVDDIFDSQGGRKKWKKLAPSTIRRRRKRSNRILQDTGALAGSVTGPNKRFGYLKIRKMKMIIGTTLFYAGTHNYGRDQVPKREFLQKPTNAVARDMAREYMTVYRRTLRRR